jgi:dihydroorotase
VQLLRDAKRRGISVSGEACPHHFTLTDTVLAGSEKFWSGDGQNLIPANKGEWPWWPSYDTNFKMNPPLRTAQDRAAILEGLVDGTLEIISSDHAPHCDYEKETEFDYAPFGIVGFETELALALMQLYHAGRLGLSEVIAKFTVAPAGLLRLHGKGALNIGADGDLTVFDPDEEWIFDVADSASKSKNSPFSGWCLKGRAKAVIVRGVVVFEGEARAAAPAGK